MQLTQEQQTIIQTISNKDCNFVKINAVSGAGKAQPLSEKVLTPYGWKTMEELNIGDKVIGSDGKSKTIIGVFPQGIRQIFKVSFIDGTSVLCDKDHLWTVHRNRYIETKTTKEIMDTWIEKKRLDKRYNTYSSQFNYSIDLVKPVKYELDYELSIDPYLLGLLLGDGGFSGQTVQFTNSSKEIIENLEKLLPDNDKLELNQKITYRIVSKEKWKQSDIKKELIKYELYGKLSTEKHIPKEYLYSDIESRKKLYQGLIDSDGYVKNGQLKEYSTSSKQLAEDFLELARSLGMNVSCKERLPKYTYKNKKIIGQKNYRIRHLVSKKTKSIVSIEYSHDEEAKCIKIDSEDSLYVTNGFNLTHNTSSLIAIAQHLNVKQGLYISYNKAIATEASEKFGTGIQCKTIHSLAYGFTVKHFSLKLVSTLKARIITERIPYIRKALLLETLSKYFLSRHITIQSFVESEYAEGIFSQEDVDLMKNYFIKMKEGKCDCSHDFYLKLFHILLHHGIVKTPEYELLMLDEAGDVNGTSLEIFRLIKAIKRIMVGDNQQNIYSFNNTINGFKALEEEGRSLKLTQSFRVSDQLAPIIEEFCHQYLDSTMEFRGVHYDSKPSKEEQTIFYIARTNGGIIEKMIELEDEHTPYNLTRPVKAIFQLPLILLMLSKDWKTEIYVEEYKFLENDAREFANDVDLQKHFKESILAYFANEHADDPSVMSAINLIMRFGPQKIFACNKKALEHEKHHETHKVTITSAHSSKGLQADIVHILPDMNGALDKIVAKQHEYVDNMIQLDKTSNKNWTFDPIKYEYFDKKQPNMELLSKQAQEEFRLYYVAVTRTKYDVYDAEWLSEPDFITMFPEDSSINLRGTFDD